MREELQAATELEHPPGDVPLLAHRQPLVEHDLRREPLELEVPLLGAAPLVVGLSSLVVGLSPLVVGPGLLLEGLDPLCALVLRDALTRIAATREMPATRTSEAPAARMRTRFRRSHRENRSPKGSRTHGMGSSASHRSMSSARPAADG